MIEIDERITRVTRAERVPTGVRVTLEFNRSAPLTAGQKVRCHYHFEADGRSLDCVGIPQPTHVVARRDHLDVFHYRLSQWIATAVPREPVSEAPAADQSPA
jgi:hypothetical protein